MIIAGIIIIAAASIIGFISMLGFVAFDSDRADAISFSIYVLCFIASVVGFAMAGIGIVQELT